VPGSASQPAPQAPARLHHGVASLHLMAGTQPAIVSKLLEHSQLSITADLYAHMLEGFGRSAVDAAAELVPRTPRITPRRTGPPTGTPSPARGIKD